MISEANCFVILDGELATPGAIDLYDIKEIVGRLSGSKPGKGEGFNYEDLTKIAEAVCLISRKSDFYLKILGYC